MTRDNTLALEAHARACEGCGAQMQRLAALRGALRSPGVRFQAPAVLRERLTAQVSDQHVVKPWFNGKVQFAPPVPDLADLGFALAGGRLDYVDRHLAAVVVYRRRQHVINLFVWRSVAQPLPRGFLSRRDGYNLLHWSSDGLEFWVVSDVNSDELQRFRSTFMKRSEL